MDSTFAARWRARLPYLLLAIVGLVYAKCLPTFFVQDDFWFLRDTYKPFSTRLMLAGGLPEYLRPIPTYWLPLLNRHLWGLSPFGFHISQMLCLLATVYALYSITLRWTKSSLAASVAAIVYGLSKVHLYNVCWVAGGIDTTAGCFMALTLLAIVRYEQSGGSLASIAVASALALLSKESAIIVIIAWVGAVLTRAAARRFLPPESDQAANSSSGMDRGHRLAALAGWFCQRELRITLLLSGIVVAYMALRVSLISIRPELGLDLARFKYLIKSSIISILPIIEPRTPISKAWILLPLTIAAGAFLLPPARRAHEAMVALLLWLSHAAIFAVSVNMPPLLQLYYAHFNVIGLALLAGLCCAGLLERCSRQWVRLPMHATLVVLLGAYAYQSAVVVRESIETNNSMALFKARYSLEAYNQLRYQIGVRPYHSVVFLGASEEMWWAMGMGDMFISMFPGVEAHFDGKKGYQAPPGVKTDDATLVVRQVSEFQFDVVR